MNKQFLRAVALPLTSAMLLAFGATAAHAQERPVATQQQMQERVEKCKQFSSEKFGVIGEEAGPDSPAAKAALGAMEYELSTLAKTSDSEVTRQFSDIKYADAQVLPHGAKTRWAWIVKCVVSAAISVAFNGWPSKDRIIRFIAEIAVGCLFGVKFEWAIGKAVGLIWKFKKQIVAALTAVSMVAANALAAAPKPKSLPVDVSRDPATA